MTTVPSELKILMEPEKIYKHDYFIRSEKLDMLKSAISDTL